MAIVVEVINKDIEFALKKFKRKVKKANVLIDYYEAQSYKKPSEKKREKRIKAKTRNKYKVLEDKCSDLI